LSDIIRNARRYKSHAPRFSNGERGFLMRRHIRPGDFWRLARTCPRLSPIVEDAYALPPIQFLRVLVRPNVTAVLHKTTFNKDKLISRPVIIPAVSR
jgi:hypothetical protein